MVKTENRKIARITLDWDTRNLFEIGYNIFKVLFFYSKNIHTLELRPSTKKGYHVIIWLKHLVTIDKMFLMRKVCCDDPLRIKLDKERYARKEPIQLLFSKKTDFFYKRKKKKGKK